MRNQDALERRRREAEGEESDSERQPRKFEKREGGKPFKGGKSFGKDGKSFDKGGKSFDRAKKSFDRKDGKKPFARKFGQK